MARLQRQAGEEIRELLQDTQTALEDAHYFTVRMISKQVNQKLGKLALDMQNVVRQGCDIISTLQRRANALNREIEQALANPQFDPAAQPLMGLADITEVSLLTTLHKHGFHSLRIARAYYTLGENADTLSEKANSFQTSAKISARLGFKDTEARALEGAARVYHKTGAIEKAVAAYKQCLELLSIDYPATAGVSMNIGIILASQGRHQEAVAAYTQAVEAATAVGKDSTTIKFNLGLSLSMNQQHEAAEHVFRELVEVAQSYQAAFSLGKLLINTGRQEEGLRYLHQASASAETAGDAGQVFEALSLILSHSPNPEVLDKLRSLLIWAPDQQLKLKIIKLLLQKYFDSGEYMAVTQLFPLIAEPSNPQSLSELYKILGLAHSRLGHSAEAADAFTKAWPHAGQASNKVAHCIVEELEKANYIEELKHFCYELVQQPTGSYTLKFTAFLKILSLCIRQQDAAGIAQAMPGAFDIAQTADVKHQQLLTLLTEAARMKVFPEACIDTLSAWTDFYKEHQLLVCYKMAVMLQADLRLAQQRYEIAEKLYQEVYHIQYVFDSPADLARTLHLRGLTLRYLGKLTQALNLYNKAQAIFDRENLTPEQGQVRCHKGTLLFLNKQYQEACNEYLEAVQFVTRPREQTDLYYNLSRAFAELAEYDKAFDEIEKAVRICETNDLKRQLAEVLAQEGFLYYKKQQKQAAQQSYIRMKDLYSELYGENSEQARQAAAQVRSLS